MPGWLCLSFLLTGDEDTGHPAGVWGTAERPSVHGGLLVPKKPWLRGNRPDGAALSVCTPLPARELSFQVPVPPPSGPREEEEGLVRPGDTEREEGTLAILPGAGLDPNLRWSVPNDRPTKLPVLSNRPWEGEVLPEALGPSSPPLPPLRPWQTGCCDCWAAASPAAWSDLPPTPDEGRAGAVIWVPPAKTLETSKSLLWAVLCRTGQSQGCTSQAVSCEGRAIWEKLSVPCN